MISGLNVSELVKSIKDNSEPAVKRDFLGDTAKMVYKENRLLINTSTEVIGFESTKLCDQQIAGNLGIPIKYWEKMQEKAPDLLESNVNRWFKQDNETRMVRTLQGSARAFLSSKYRQLDNIDIALNVFPKIIDAGFEVKSSQITEKHMYVQLVTQRIQGEVKKGDVVQAGLTISNSEVGCGSLKVEPLIYRLVCTNGMIAAHSLAKRHIGRNQIGNDIENAFEIFTNDTKNQMDKSFWMQVNDLVSQVASQETFNKLLENMRTATTVEIKRPTEAIELVQRRYNVSDDEKDNILNNLIGERDSSKWGLVNAITATANTMNNYERAIEIERIGGEVLELPATDTMFRN